MQTDKVPLTREAYERLRRELEYLRTVRRREIAAEIRDAWESELDKDDDVALPFETAKEDQAVVESRIATLEDILARATIIDEAAARASDTVTIGSVVVLVDDRGEEHVYQIVSPVESDPATGKLSVESPVGAALLGKRAGERVRVQTPSGVKEFLLKELR
jgi:transcription elongation factor GreA